MGDKVDELQIEIAERLKRVRLALDYGQTELATVLEISPQRYYNYESGRRPMDIEIAVKLCTKERLPIEWLFMGVKDRLRPALARRLARIAPNDRSQ